MKHKGKIERLVKILQLGYVREDRSGELFGFKFDAIEGYRGESLSEVGLKPGSTVDFDLSDGRIVRLRLATNVRAAAAH